MHETLLSPPLIRRVFLEINGAKNQNARSGAETRGEAKRGRRMLGQDFSRGILFRGSRGGGGRLYTPVVKSYLHLGGRLINYRLYRSLDVPRDCSGLIADLTVIPCVCVCVTVLLVPLGNDWTRARVDPV